MKHLFFATGDAAAGNGAQDAKADLYEGLFTDDALPTAANAAADKLPEADLAKSGTAADGGKNGSPNDGANGQAAGNNDDDDDGGDNGKQGKGEGAAKKTLTLDDLQLTDEEIETQLRADAGNVKKFMAANTQRAMSLADDKKAFAAEKEQHFAALDQRLAQINELANQLNARLAGAGANRNAFENFGAGGENDGGFEEGGMDARTAARIKRLEESLGLMAFERETSAKDAELKARFQDYDPARVRARVMNLNPADLNEVIYKAEQFDKFDFEGMKKQYIKLGQDMLLKKLQHIQEESRKVKAPVAGGSSTGGEKKLAKPKSFEEARLRVAGSASALFTED